MAAHAAFPAWSRTTPQERHDILLRASMEIIGRRDELGRSAGPRRGQDAAGGDRRSRARGTDLRFLRRRGVEESRREVCLASGPNVDIEATREPVGVVGIIAPWNFPIAIPAWKIAPALAFGNAVVFKPADLVPGSAHALAEIIVRAGVPKGVFNLVMGRGSVVGQAILDHKQVDAVTFTGSVATGRRVAAACAGAMRKFQLEMGGKNPLVVLADADLPNAVECAVNGAYFSTGQRCTASSRIIVEEPVYTRFADALIERMRGARRRRRAEAGHAYRTGGRPEPARPGSLLRRDRQGRGREARARRRAAQPRDARLLHGAGSLHRRRQFDADLARGDLRAGRRR